MDEDCRTAVRSDWALEIWAASGFDALTTADPSSYFTPDRGTGQGDVSSPCTWVAVFDIVLCAMARVQSTDHSFLLTSPSAPLLPAPDIAYADDLLSVARTLHGLQLKADMISLCSIILGLSIAVKKLRTFHLLWSAPHVENLLFHNEDWNPSSIKIPQTPSIHCLGVTFNLDLSGKIQYAITTSELRRLSSILASSCTSPSCILAVIRSSTISKIAYPAVLSSWSLSQLKEFDNILAVAFRKLSKNLRSSQLENLFQPPEKGGLGLPRLSHVILERKRETLERLLKGDPHTRFTMESLQHRALTRLSSDPSPSSTRGLWMGSLLAFGSAAGVVRFPPCPPLSDRLPSSPPQGSRPLEVGQFWQITPPEGGIPRPPRIIEIAGLHAHSSLVQYRPWQPHDPSSHALLPGLRIRLSPQPLGARHHSSALVSSLFPLQHSAKLLSLHPPPHPSRSRSPTSLRIIHQIIPELLPTASQPTTPSLPPPPAPPLSLEIFSHTQHALPSEPFANILTEHPTLHITSILVIREFDSLDNENWTVIRYRHLNAEGSSQPTEYMSHSLTTLAALDYASRHRPLSPVTIYIPHTGLRKALLSPSPPRSRKQNQLGTVHSRIRALMSPLRTLLLSKSLGKSPFNQDWDSLRLGSFLAYQQLSLTPTPPHSLYRIIDTIPDLPYSSLLSSLSVSQGWTWIDSNTGLFSVAELITKTNHHNRILALQRRDADRARRGDLPKWSTFDTIPFAARQLHFKDSSISTRSFLERLLHERHHSVGHNKSKNIKDSILHATALQCPLCMLPDSYDHWIRDCQQPPSMAACRLDHIDNMRSWAASLEVPDSTLATYLILLSLKLDGYRVSLGNWSLPLYRELCNCPNITPQEEQASKIFTKFQSLSLTMILQIWQIRNGLLGSTAPSLPPRLPRTPRLYAVRSGRIPGIYDSHDAALAQTSGFPGAEFKRFRSRIEAQTFLDAPPPPWADGQLDIVTDGSYDPAN